MLAAVAVLAVAVRRAGAAPASRARPPTRWSGRAADSFQATERYRERFGDDSIVVLVRGELPNLVLTANLGRLLGLEGCLSGNKPAGERGRRAARARRARELARTEAGARSSSGPARSSTRRSARSRTQLEQRSGREGGRGRARGRGGAPAGARPRGRSPAEQRKAAEAARQLVYAEFVRDLLQLALKYGLGLTGVPTLDDPNFVSQLVFDARRGATTPKARFAYLFPSPRSAVIQVRLKPDLSDEAAQPRDRRWCARRWRCRSGS